MCRTIINNRNQRNIVNDTCASNEVVWSRGLFPTHSKDLPNRIHLLWFLKISTDLTRFPTIVTNHFRTFEFICKVFCLPMLETSQVRFLYSAIQCPIPPQASPTFLILTSNLLFSLIRWRHIGLATVLTLTLPVIDNLVTS